MVSSHFGDLVERHFLFPFKLFVCASLKGEGTRKLTERDHLCRHEFIARMSVCREWVILVGFAPEDPRLFPGTDG